MSYCTRADLEAAAGTSNILKWADLDNTKDTAKIAATIAAAIAAAEADIDGEFLDGPYSIPFTTAPPLVTKWATILAVGNLYSARGIADVSAEGEEDDKWGRRAKGVRREILWYSSGSLRLDAALSYGPRPTAPQVVVPTMPRYTGGSGGGAL